MRIEVRIQTCASEKQCELGIKRESITVQIDKYSTEITPENPLFKE